MAVCLDSIMAKKLLKWNHRINASIQWENVQIAKKGSKLRESYLDLVDAVSDRFIITLDLQKQLNHIPLLTMELKQIEQNISSLCNKLDKLNGHYETVLTEKHNSRMENEKSKQTLYLKKEREKCDKQYEKERNEQIEFHNILKMQELSKRKKNEIK